jgi:hypothetical protein
MAEVSQKESATSRTFNCRDLLWEIFERIAKEDGCSVDELVNHSMQSYATPRAERTPLPQGVAFKDLENPIGERAPYVDPTGRSPSQPHFRAVLPSASGGPPPLPTPMLPPVQPSGAPARQPPPLPMPASASYGVSPESGPPPGSGAPDPYAPRLGALPQLFVMVAGERYQVSKERYVIGRGSRSSDLVIRDPNVSRQHALVELSNGRFHMVDMGSVNGVEHHGSRIARKAIEDGDRFDICGHEIVFSTR